MGAWGEGILSDDTVRDVHDDYFDFFNRGDSPEEIRKKILAKYSEDLTDQDEGPLIWLAIAKAQWDCAHLEPVVYSKVREIVQNSLGLDRWAEQGERLLLRRKKALAQFLKQLESPNLRARKPRKATKRKPIFQPGDCIAVRLEDGEWGAILVLKNPPETDDPYKDTYGVNLIAVLHYKSQQPPTLSVFEKRQWLHLTHHSWRNQAVICNVMALRFKGVKDRLTLVGSIPLRDSDPCESKTYSPWSAVVQSMYLQDRWDRGIRD